jgi:sialate O-acetylesterase
MTLHAADPLGPSIPHVLLLVLGTLSILSAAACSAPPSDIEPSRLFDDGMVLQRDVDLRVWGTARPDAMVSVDFLGASYQAPAEADGTWMIRLDAAPAGGPHEMRISGEGYERTIRDVLVGDVWVASGQSNMEWTVDSAWDAPSEIAAADDPMIRQFLVPKAWSAAPVDSVVGGPWMPADPAHVGGFTAIGYFFAREIRQHHDVPIGIIHASWGGSRLEPWMSAESLGLDEAGVAALMQAEREREQIVLAAIRERIGPLPERDGGIVDGAAVWADPDLDEAGWERIPVPSTWEAAGFPGMDGVAWYRTAFDLTAAEAAAGVTLGLGMIDDSDRTWVNGSEVAGMEMSWNVAREYPVPASALREGRNVVAVRVVDTGGGGGIAGSADQVFLEAGGRRRSITGEWAFRVGEVRVAMDASRNQVPVLLYNAMIHPLEWYRIKGVIWYQGESNTGPGDALAYRDLFATMIQDWRSRWGVGDFPFLWAQLANFNPPADQPGESGWAVLRESQSATLSVSNTAQAVLIDIGEAGDIHPKNKQDVGYRLALGARALAYGEDLVHSGPTYGGHTVDAGRILVGFDHVGGGLRAATRPITAPRAEGRATADRLTGFAIAGADRRFVWAEARILGDQVIVSSPRVPNPVAVRYAWADNPDRANLYNVEGLPASPFRTDDW